MVARDLPPEARVTKLDMAQARFAKALDALEAAVLPLAEARGRAARDSADIARLKEERDRLLARVAELEDETRSLAGLTEEVEGRLDGAIAEIRSALGR
jgi:chromosome segregation ATPase